MQMCFVLNVIFQARMLNARPCGLCASYTQCVRLQYVTVRAIEVAYAQCVQLHSRTHTECAMAVCAIKVAHKVSVRLQCISRSSHSLSLLREEKRIKFTILVYLSPDCMILLS
jgi:hypothetical protein